MTAVPGCLTDPLREGRCDRNGAVIVGAGAGVLAEKEMILGLGELILAAAGNGLPEEENYLGAAGELRPSGEESPSPAIEQLGSGGR